MNILVIAPHPDDEVIGCGGTIARHSDQGDDVWVAIVTKGDPEFATENEIETVRKEQLKAAEILGVSNTIFLDFPAAKLDVTPRARIANAIREIIVRHETNVLYVTHHGDLHKDHSIVNNATLVAARPIAGSSVEEIFAYETLSETDWAVPNTANWFVPNYYVDISHQFERKMNAMACYESQLKSAPHPRSLKALKNLSEYRGATVGISYSEAFVTLRRIWHHPPIS